jgi:hypothetical protein
MCFMQKGIFEGNWFTSGTPTFLMTLMREQDSFLFNQLQTTGHLVNIYDIENLDVRTVMFQSGYLTIKNIDYGSGNFTLDYPNREVEEAL